MLVPRSKSLTSVLINAQIQNTIERTTTLFRPRRQSLATPRTRNLHRPSALPTWLPRHPGSSPSLQQRQFPVRPGGHSHTGTMVNIEGRNERGTPAFVMTPSFVITVFDIFKVKRGRETDGQGGFLEGSATRATQGRRDIMLKRKR